MQTSLTFRHIESTEALKNHTNEKISHLKKYLDDSAHMHVVLSTERHAQRADIQLSSHGMILHGQEDSSDLYNSIDRAVEKLEHQIRRYKDKHVDHKSKEGARLKAQLSH